MRIQTFSKYIIVMALEKRHYKYYTIDFMFISWLVVFSWKIAHPSILIDVYKIFQS